MGVEIGELGVRVSLTLEGDPLITTAAQMSVTCKTPQGNTLNDVITQARATCMVANSLSRGLPVTISVT
jgi:organic hydroperoxide reductase OsmC/OhrA